MIKLAEVVDILKKTENTEVEDEDMIAYFDKQEEKFTLFASNDDYELDSNIHNPARLEELLQSNDEIKKLYEMREDETHRFVFIKNPLTKNQLVTSYIDQYSKDKKTYGKLLRSYSGYGRYSHFKKCLSELSMLNNYYDFCSNKIEMIAIKWCLKNNIAYEK